MRVALVQAPVWWTLDPPLGLAQLAGCLRQAGHEPLVFDVNMSLWSGRSPAYESLWNWEQFEFWNQPEFVARFFAANRALVEAQVEAILRSDAPVVGFSVCSGSQLATLGLVRLIKAASPSRRVVLGGQYFRHEADVRRLLCEPGVDAVVQGAGDRSFLALLQGGWEPGPGVWVKRGEEIVPGGPPEPVRDLDALPFLDLASFPMDLYTDGLRIPIQSSRGCVWRCRFCSSHGFWKGYAHMSGERICAEVLHQRRLFPKRTSVEFYDLTANGDVASLHRFAVLLAQSGCFLGWKINAIIRPEMTAGVLRDLKRANCNYIIYGIESGSERVLRAMNKPYSPAVADRVLQDTHAAGICTTANFMFGFPGETEADFQETLAFLRRNRPHLDRVYGSATFTSLEEGSELLERREQFGVRPQSRETLHNLYWESADGTNTYPVRLERYLRFREAALSLGLDSYKGVNGSLEQHRLSGLARYHEFAGQPATSLRMFLDYLELDPGHEPTFRDLRRLAAPLEALLAAARALPAREEAQRCLAGTDARVDEAGGRLFVRWMKEPCPDPRALEELARRAQAVLAAAQRAS